MNSKTIIIGIAHLPAALLLPVFARASKNFIDDKAAYAILATFVTFIVLLISNFLLAVINVRRKKKSIRVYNIIATAIVSFTLFPVVYLFPLGVLVALGGLLLQVWIISKSKKSKTLSYEEAAF